MNPSDPIKSGLDFDNEVKEIVEGLLRYHPEAQKETIYKAYELSKKAHLGQKRQSGQDFLSHPLAVSKILVEMKLDVPSIITGFLHDIVEDTLVTLDEIKKEFGEDVAHLVDGVTKLSKIKFNTTEEKQAENFRKMFLAMAQDIRVIIVKLADRLHNMRTLGYIPYQKQQRISQETLDIYAPLANRLGISWLKSELEDLALRYLKPEIYYKLVERVVQKKKERQKYVDEVVEVIESTLKKYNINAQVKGRPKHFYGIYKKMEEQKLDFDQVFDVLGFRIIVDKISECYEVLGVIHSVWKPVPGRFKDYIAMPKANSYQSLHTTVVGPYGEKVEVQIRTKEMDLIAERGIAAHWHYKEGHMDRKDVESFTWLRQLVEYQKELKDPSEFLDTVRVDLFPGEIYVFTPKGKVMELPTGATPIDFAYSVHTEVGNHCVGARVNGKIVPLRHKLKSGDTIEILTDPNRLPSKDWMQFAITSRAKSKIRRFIKEEQRQRGLEIGKELCGKMFRKYSLNFQKFYMSEDLKPIAKTLNYKSVDNMIVAVGYGLLGAENIAQKCAPIEVLKKEESVKRAPPPLSKEGSVSHIKVRGLDDILVHHAKCCNPLKGDSIIGFVTRGRGVTIHRANCAKMLASDPQRKIEVSWDRGVDVQRRIKVKVICLDKKGLLVEMSKVFTDSGINIVSAQIRTTRDKKAINIFTVNVTDTNQLREVMRTMEGLDGVISVERL